MRNLTKTLAVVSILAPASAHPLGIGDIKLHSALNQNLNAEIALILSGERPEDIQVNLAPPDKFNEAGVPWSYFLSKIRFETVTRSNGSVIIKLTSNEALKEPFLDLLLEVSWPKGNLYREFTVLVDPPAVYKEATIPVLTNSERYQQSEQQNVIPQRRTASSKTQTHFATKGEYGPTRRNDTLWKIAEQVRPDNDISVEQMMMALYEQNPRAFYQENVNALSAGKTLKVPEREVILKLSRKQALAEFNRQTKAWRNHLAPAAVETVPVKEEGLVNQLTLDAPAEATVNETAVIAPGNEQVAASDEKIDKPAQAAPGEAVVNDAIQSKIAALEKQLAAMQQIITLKDQQLAALQSRTQVNPVVQDKPAPPEPEPVVLADQQSQPTPVKQELPIKSEPVAQEQPAQQAPSVAQAVKPVTQAKPTVRPVVQPQAESSSDLYYPIVAGVGASVLALIGGLWWRKRKIEEEMNSESMFASSLKSKALGSGSGVAADSMGSNVNSSAPESSFLSEFSSTDFGSFDIDQSEIDPLSEADVYLAYGRYHQAEELIRHAINDFPARDDCKLKLLEIFHATENKNAFEAYANELAVSGKNNDLPFWAKVTEMASDICPDSSLFSSAAVNFRTEMNSSPNVTTVILGKRNAIGREERDHQEFVVTQNLINSDAKLKTATAKESVLDFDLTSFAAKDDDIVPDDQQDNASIEFELGSLASDAITTEETKDRIVDFNFDSVDDDSNDDFTVDQKQIESIDFGMSSNEKPLNTDDFQGFDFSIDESSGLNEKVDNISLDDEYQFNFDLEMPLEAQKNDLGVSDLTDMDELETKLDLARAYIDMGDADSAIDIVKEVLEKGSAEQKKIAQTLMVDLK